MKHNSNHTLMSARTLFIILSQLSILIFFNSCTVTNNFYVNNAMPIEKGKSDLYGGISTGFKPNLDSTGYNISHNLSAGLQTCIGNLEKTSVRAAIHFPEIIGGFGARLGIQQSFLDKNSNFNIAFGTDIGFTAAKDSVKNFINGRYEKIQNDIKGSYNFDFFLPMSFRLKKNTLLTLTPRYTFTFISVKKVADPKVFCPALTLGFKYKKLYFESTATYYHEKIVPFFGIGLVFTELN